PQDLSHAFTSVAKKVEPAVVNIEVIERAKETSQSREFQLFPQIPGLPRLAPMPSQPQRLGGSGVIISPDGYILTNNHVAGAATQINVTLADGRKFKATRVGTDPETDLAVIKINTDGLPYATLGDSDKVQQGEWVVALGSPFGLQQTMTAGIISATGRSLGNSTYDNYIQTDASINPGNSGGPLVNMDGEIIGINTEIVSRSGGNEGIGFAIPSDLVRGVEAQLIKTGKVVRGYLGVYLKPVSEAYAKTFGYDKAGGALVEDVSGQDAPAARAGLKSGDIIVEFDGKPVKSPRELTNIVAEEPVGKTVQAKYVRDGKLGTTTIRLAERNIGNGAAGENGDEDNPTGKLGIGVATVTPDIASQLKLKIETGVVVQEVEPGSPADEAGIQQGDVIHKVGRVTVTSAADLRRVLTQLGNQKQIVIQIENQQTGLGWVTLSLE
ncbi:MAG TPA: Do family serine endopeptidase, partial [Blastocatellia bacterium]|nr:Do family serine endopeptidase [Blastocatellia bacterium]